MSQRHSGLRNLYQRWEHQRWDPEDIPTAADVANWPQINKDLQALFLSALNSFYLGDKAVAELLPQIQAFAPSVEERIFLDTQIADERQHELFLRRFIYQVVGVRGNDATMLAAVEQGVPSALLEMLNGHLVQAVDDLQRCKTTAAWVRAVVTYHIVVEGYLAFRGEDYFQQILSQINPPLPGFAKGLALLIRDESRHVGYGVYALCCRVRENQANASIIALRLLELGPTVSAIVDELPSADRELSPQAIKLRQALESIGLSEKAIATACRQYR